MALAAAEADADVSVQTLKREYVERLAGLYECPTIGFVDGGMARLVRARGMLYSLGRCAIFPPARRVSHVEGS